jgi:hypothetical protein
MSEATIAAPAAGEPVWKLNDRVIAKFKGGKAYPGKVVALQGNGTFTVKFDDGDLDESVKAEDMQPLVVPEWKAGDRVVAKFKGGKAYPGKVTAARGPGVWAVTFDDGDVDEFVKAANIQALALPEYSLNERVAARFKGGKAYPGVIAQVHGGGMYGVLFDDGDCDDSVKVLDIQKCSVPKPGKPGAVTSSPKPSPMMGKRSGVKNSMAGLMSAVSAFLPPRAALPRRCSRRRRRRRRCLRRHRRRRAHTMIALGVLSPGCPEEGGDCIVGQQRRQAPQHHGRRVGKPSPLSLASSFWRK